MDVIDLFDEVNYINSRRKKRKHPSFTKLSVSNYDDYQFQRRFRMKKSSFYKLLRLIQEDIKFTDNRCSPTPPEIQLMTTLRFYATGSFQEVQGDLIGLTQPTISRCVKRVSIAIAELSKIFITFPDRQERFNVKEKFYSISSFPGVIGAIDGTHIEVTVPSKVQERFRNRKNRISINVQAVVDADMKFINLVARWPGSVHDSRILRNSQLYDYLETEVRDGHLLGDAAYPCRTYLMTPLTSTSTPAEEKYQRAHVKTRNVVERTFGAWKRRFSCLASKLRLKLSTSLTVIVACGVLWNFLIKEKDDEYAGVDGMERVNQTQESESGDSSGFSKRRLLINTHFL